MRAALAPRLARWLRMTHDRAESNQLQVTHEFLAHILNRMALKRASCECDRTVNDLC